MKRNKILPWMAVLTWMTVIFLLSAETGQSSNSLSTGITRDLLDLIQKYFTDAGDMSLDTFNHIIRKTAHFTAYMLLGILMMHAARVREAKKIMLLFGVCVLYAASDEFHQLFVPGRGGQIRDVILDSAGAAFGIGVYILLGFAKRKVGEIKIASK